MEVEVVEKEEFLEEIERLSDPNVPLDKLEVQDEVYLRALLRSIEVEGLKDPLLILVEESGRKMLWDGHHRLIVLKRLGRKTAPVVYGSRESFDKFLSERSFLWDRHL